jgi:D-alanyl-D-alanine carboxypeptidase
MSSVNFFWEISWRALFLFRSHEMRLWRMLGFCASFLAPFTSSAWAGTPALVIDAQTGQVIHAENATQPWYPASITKLMTAYVALREVKAGRIKLDKPMLVTTRAASAPPSKMGFKPGMEVTLDNALKIIMVKSANDVATTIAEGVGGSVETFAALMNAEAARLGMVESRFVNPHGLPDSGQQTSARDMAVLAMALINEFPEHQELFQIGAIRLGRKVMKNHNGLIGRYAGADGMKTGFICSSGFNVVASATRGGRRLIAVVMGSNSAAERTIKTAALFDQGFASSGWGGRALHDLPSSFSATAPDMRQEVCGKRRAPIEDDAETASLGTMSSGNSNPALDMIAAPAISAAIGSGRKLGPRAALAVVDVYIGRAPGYEPRAVASKEIPEKKSKKGNTGLPASAQAYQATAESTDDVIGKTLKPSGAIRTKVQAVSKPAPPAKPVIEQNAKLGSIASPKEPKVNAPNALGSVSAMPPSRPSLGSVSAGKPPASLGSLPASPKPRPLPED